jgi:ATP-dependent RNA helicase RhlE
VSEFSSLGLSQPLMQAIQEAGYTQATPIQAKSIMPIAEGRDVLGIAQTGTGKTAAFAIPLLERMLKKPGKAGPGRMRILVLTPTRELAAQVEASFRKYGRHVRLSTAVIFGGVGQGQQVKALSRGLDLVVATPGRLLDLMQQRHAKFDQVETFVLDEADRMLDMGFIRDIRKIVAVLPPVRQTLLFSATLPDEIAHLAAEQLKDPIRVEVAPPSTTVERVTQTLCFVDKSKKRDLLRHFLADKSILQALVFTRTKHGADRVTEDLLAHGIEAGAIHGNKAQNHRERTLRSYRNGTLRVLVATDIAARGLDIPGVSHVFNFDLPDEPESYVHRIGRTARAGREGVAVAFCSHDELEQLRDVERNIGMVLEVDDKQPLHIALQRMPERGRGSAGPSRQGGQRRPQGGHQHQSRNQGSGRPQGSSRPQGVGNRPSEGLRNDYGERRGPRNDRPADGGAAGSGRRDRPRHEGQRPQGASYSPSSGSGSSSGARPAQRGGQGRRRGTGQGGGQGSGPSSNAGGVGGFFSAIKKRFKG